MRKGDRETVIVPGGSGGIGREIVRELSEKNYNVINFDLITPEKLFKNEKFSSVNLRKENEIIAAFEEVKSENKNLYSLVYSAGWGGPFHSILDVKSTEWNMIMDVNLKGAFLCIREILPTLVQNKKGRILLIGSLFSRVGSKNSVVYSASKHALAGMVKSLADEWGPSGITSNLVSPGYVNTSMGIQEDKISNHMKEIVDKTPSKRIAEPAEIARVVTFLLDKESGYINGANWAVDGGMSAI